MSYLDAPRFHFSGHFWTNPSTINNATENYALTEVYNNNPPSAINPNSVWWNPKGQAFFKITDATVTAAVGDSGIASYDALVGAQIVSIPMGGPPGSQHGRLVDLDPDQQARSLIVGLRLQLTMHGAVALTGTIRGMCILDIWGRVVGGSGGGIASAGCQYTSVIEDIEWGDTSPSTILTQLRSASPDLLSFKMNVDAYNGTITSDQFGYGRVVASIGPQDAGEPAHFVAQRRMAQASSQSLMNVTPFQVKGTRATIDLGNSVPTTAPNAGPFKDLGPVSLVIGDQSIPIYDTVQEYASQYATTAGIFDVDLGSAATAAASTAMAISIAPPSQSSVPAVGKSAVMLKEGLDVALATTTASGTRIDISESSDGMYAAPDYVALRLENGAPAWAATADALSGTQITQDAQIPLIVTKFGKRAANVTIAVQVATQQYQFPNSQGQPYDINNTPMSAINWPQSAVTDADGVAMLNFSAGPLSLSEKAAAEPRRAAVDGQMYYFTHTYQMDTQQPISILVFEDSPHVDDPVWYGNVEPIFLQYARLYPAMRNIIDLSDYATVTGSPIREKLIAVFSVPPTHPGYMPVTRDLSYRNRTMLLRWLANPQKGTQS